MSEQDLGSYNLRLDHCDNFSSLCAVSFHFRLCHVETDRMLYENPCPCALLVSFTASDFFWWHLLNTPCSTRCCLVPWAPSTLLWCLSGLSRWAFWASLASLDNVLSCSPLWFPITVDIFGRYNLLLPFLLWVVQPSRGWVEQECGWLWCSIFGDTLLALNNVTILICACWCFTPWSCGCFS